MSSATKPVLTGVDEGLTAPQFKSISICNGEYFDLHELANQHRGIILTFFRGSW